MNERTSFGKISQRERERERESFEMQCPFDKNVRAMTEIHQNS
jgi:hypothetical protein